MQETTNLKLKKPDLTDYVNVVDLNENADKIDAAVTGNKETLATHLAEDATDAHKASNISFAPSNGMTSINIQQAILEAFQSGNSRKIAMVDALLSIDASLPITHSSSWAEIELAVGVISTGLKTSSGTFKVPTGVYAPEVTITGLDFEPKAVFVFYHDIRITNATYFFASNFNPLYPDDLFDVYYDVTDKRAVQLIQRNSAGANSSSGRDTLTSGNSFSEDGFSFLSSLISMDYASKNFKWVAIG